jgi:hypothetical protein
MGPFLYPAAMTMIRCPKRGSPFDTAYGQRELHVRDLDALPISFRQKIETE